MPDELRERVFRLFYRGPSHASVAGSGTGLALVRRIALQHGGDAWVQPAPGGGARFVFTIPDPDVAGP